MMDCNGFMDFEKQYGADAAAKIADTICEAMCGQTQEDVFIDQLIRHNACNHTASGVVWHNGVAYGFVADSGDWCGFVVREFGPSEEPPQYQPPEPTRYTFVPAKENPSPQERAIYEQWKVSSWFLEKVRAYNYDRHFAPGVKTETHYREWAAQKGLRVALID